MKAEHFIRDSMYVFEISYFSVSQNTKESNTVGSTEKLSKVNNHITPFTCVHSHSSFVIVLLSSVLLKAKKEQHYLLLFNMVTRNLKSFVSHGHLCFAY